MNNEQRTPHDIFISYSSHDQSAAEAICRALEGAHLRCWIAHRDLAAGSGWPGVLVDVIERSKAVVVVFSGHANESAQVVRELEAAVSQRIPLIPIRVTDHLPTRDMKYFLGVSHWFTAHPEPIETYLPQIIDLTRHVLAGESSGWTRALRYLPENRNSRVVLAVSAVVAVAALIVGWSMRNASAENPLAALANQYAASLTSPLEGRWQAELPDARGRRVTCVFDVAAMGVTTFSPDCPLPLKGESANLQATKDGTWAPELFEAGTHTGTFIFMGGELHNTKGVYRLEGRTGLVTRDGRLGEVTWKRIKAEGKLSGRTDAVVPARMEWPVRDVPAMAQRAIEYVRGQWQADAALMSLHLKKHEYQNAPLTLTQTPSGPIEIRFEFYSPNTQHGFVFRPNDTPLMNDTGPQDVDIRRALPASFVDLPELVQTLRHEGMRAKEIRLAELEWSGPGCGSFRETNAVLPPCTGRETTGIKWRIVSELDEQTWVSGVSR